MIPAARRLPYHVCTQAPFRAIPETIPWERLSLKTEKQGSRTHVILNKINSQPLLGPVDTHRAAITPAIRSMTAGTPATPRLPASQSPGTPRIRQGVPDRVPPAVQIPVRLPITVRLLRAGMTVPIACTPGSAGGPFTPPALSAMRALPSMRAPQPGTIGGRIRSPSTDTGRGHGRRRGGR